MDKEQIQAALAKAKDISAKRNFNQSFDLIINLRGLDFKKQEHQIDTFITLPHARGKKVKVCALVGAELEEQAKGIFDSTIMSDNFERYKDKREIKKLANSFDFFNCFWKDFWAKGKDAKSKVRGCCASECKPKATVRETAAHNKS